LEVHISHARGCIQFCFSRQDLLPALLLVLLLLPSPLVSLSLLPPSPFSSCSDTRQQRIVLQDSQHVISLSRSRSSSLSICPVSFCELTAHNSRPVFRLRTNTSLNLRTRVKNTKNMNQSWTMAGAKAGSFCPWVTPFLGKRQTTTRLARSLLQQRHYFWTWSICAYGK